VAPQAQGIRTAIAEESTNVRRVWEAPPSRSEGGASVSATVSSGKRLDGSSATRQNGGHEKTVAKVAPAWFRRYTVGEERCGMEHGGLKGDKDR